MMKETPLFNTHMKTATKVINLKNFARPVEYSGHKEEHDAVRERAGIFDVSHMGEIEFKGKDAAKLVQKVMTNDVNKLDVNGVLYSVMCNEEGNIIDDFICYKLEEDHFLWVVNVTKTDEDLQWILKHAAGMDVEVTNVTCRKALMAIQGPNSRDILQKLTKTDLSQMKYFSLAKTVMFVQGVEVPCVISRTGYTGSLGYEIYCDREHATRVWEELILVGKPLGILPGGVAARESLRTEVGLLLNGNDMSEKNNPYEVNFGWLVALNTDFIGKEALVKISKEELTDKLVGFEIEENNTVRSGYPIFKGGKEIGSVTSGPLSRNLVGRNLGMGFVPVEHSAVGTELKIHVKGTECTAKVVEMPFRKHTVNEKPKYNTYSPFGLSFTDSHLWVKQDSEDLFTIGISDFGQRNFGEVLFADLPEVGSKLEKGKDLFWIDTYRKVWDFISPFKAEILSVNEDLKTDPSIINRYPYDSSGIMQIRTKDSEAFKELLNFEEYNRLLSDLMSYNNWTKEKRTT